jgi:MFS transporter, DHA3 family, macrolide efflux protein
MTAAATAPPIRPQAMLRHRPFRTLWLAQLVSIFGDFLALFGVISLITFRLHGTAVQVTTVTIAYILPLALIGPIAGVFVDHWNVKRVMIASDLIRGALILLLLVVRDVAQIGLILAALSVLSSFFVPAQSVTVRTIVPADSLLAANAMLTQAFYIVRLSAPFAAGALIAWLGERVCFYLDTASFVFSAGMIFTLVIVRPPRAPGEKTLRSLSRDFVEGNRFIFTHAGLTFVFLAMGIATFVMAAFMPLISIYIRDALGAGPFVWGAISSMVGIGLIAGTQVLGRVHTPSSRTSVVLGGMLGLGMGAALLGAFRNIPLAALGTFLIGFAVSFVLVPAQTLSQQETPPALMGRVSSTFMSLVSLSQVLGLLLSGYVAQALGMRGLFLACGGALALIAGAGHVWMRESRTRPGRNERPATE